MFRNLSLAFTAAVMAASTPLSAGVSEDFTGCDGLKKPKSKADGMRTGANLSHMGPGGGFRSPRGVVASCTRALERKQLKPKQKLRRAHLLRARAAAQLQLGNPDEALTDLDAAEAQLGEYRGNFFFDRSMGVSLDLLRAIALSDKGEAKAALAMANEAGKVRPYAVRPQMVSTLLQVLNTPDQESRAKLWATAIQIVPQMRELAERSMEAPEEEGEGRFESVVELAGEGALILPKSPPIKALLERKVENSLAQWAGHYIKGFDVAYAHAALGQNDRAKERQNEVQSALDSIIKVDPEAEDERDPITRLLAPLMQSLDESVFERQKALIRARVAVNEGQLLVAAEAIEGIELKETAITADLHTAYKEAKAASEAELPELAPLGPKPERTVPKAAPIAGSLLIMPEAERGMINYKKSRPNILGAIVGGALTFGTSFINGVPRTSGFKDRENEDGTITIEYIGATLSGAVVQEMTLLRAAELAREKDNERFVIVDRRDYSRYATTSMYGIEQSRILAGYKSELDIRLLDAETKEKAAIDPVVIIDALGPIYYEEGAAPATES